MKTVNQAPRINYVEAKYLKHVGNETNTKVTIRILNGTPMIYIRDFEFFSFRGALSFIRHIVETEIVTTDKTVESLHLVG